MSRWIEGEAKKSLLSTRTDIRMIYNWIDSKVFYPRNGINLRHKYGIANCTMILGVSTEWSPNKGLNEMIKIAKAMPKSAVVLVGTHLKNTKYPPNVIAIPFTDNKDELAEIYSAAVVFFNPSKQETFGLVSGEALACGTPVVVYNNTACPEFITEYTGILIKKGTNPVDAVKAMLENNEKYGREFVKNKCREFIETNFNMKKNINRYIELFNQICSK